MMMYLCPGGACIDGRWYRWNGVTNKGSGDIYEGDVVFRSGLKDGDWRLEILHHLHPIWPNIVQQF